LLSILHLFHSGGWIKQGIRMQEMGKYVF